MAEDTVAKRRKAYIDSQVKTGTTKTRKQLGQEFDDMQARKGTTAENIDDLRRKVQQYAPAYGYLLEPNSSFGADVAQVLAKAVRQSYSADKLEGELLATKYYKTTEQAARNFDSLLPQDQAFQVEERKRTLRDKIGTLNLDEQTFTDVARTAIRRGLSDSAASQLAYTAAFASGVNKPQSILQTPEVARIKSLAKSYNYDINADEIQSILTNRPMSNGVVMSETDLVNKMKANIKGVMPQLADQIDSGLSLEDIAGNYKKYAASVLEKDPNQINMFDGPYLDAFGTRETGPLSLGEWVQKLKVDPRYGWQYTNTANQQATDIGLTLARTFGKLGKSGR